MLGIEIPLNHDYVKANWYIIYAYRVKLMVQMNTNRLIARQMKVGGAFTQIPISKHKESNS